jgi:hypothetical protein
MPDYASILRRSVSALPDASPEMREAVYQRARAALARQLTAVDPPLSTRDIETQHQELEDAVVRLESEFAPQEAPAEAFAGAPGKDDFLYTPQAPAVERHAQPAGANFGQHDLGSHNLGQEAPAAPRYEEDDDDYDEDEDRPSRLPLLIALAAVVLVVIGAGAYVYAERATLFSFLNSKPAVEQPVAAVDTAAAPAEPAEPPKRADRLVNGTDAAPPPAEAPDASANTAVAEPTAPPEAPAEQAAVEPPPTAAPLETGLDQGAPAQEPVGTNLVEQRAIYYYQGSEGQAGQASEGTATWAEITKDGRPAIQATLKIPQRNVTATVTIYKNYDSTLPASHLVEVQFNGKLSESAIQRVPALVLKQTEQARGQPLAGAAVPVTNELFWIALSNDEDEVVRNVQLLREGSWFDIPILFADQTRALITFEKGIPGDKVFETVMASWTPS